MANALWQKAREEFLNGAISWGSDNIKAILLASTTNTFDLAAANPVKSDLTIGTGAVSGNLTGKTVTNGIADAADTLFTGVSVGNLNRIVIFKDTGTPSTSRLIALLDTVSSGLPISPSAEDVLITWDNGANKIFKL